MKTYYEMIPKDDDEAVGVLFTEPNPEIPDRAYVEIDLILKYAPQIRLVLKEGVYAHFMSSDMHKWFFSQELKDFIESKATDPTHFEFIPVPVSSPEYGDRTYYFLNFKTDLDVVDIYRSRYFAGTDNLIRRRLKYDVVEKMNFFSTYEKTTLGEHYFDSIIVSAGLRRAIARHKLNSGLGYIEIGAIEETDNIPVNQTVVALQKLHLQLYDWMMAIAKEQIPDDIICACILFKVNEDGRYAFYLTGSTVVPANFKQMSEHIDFIPKEHKAPVESIYVNEVKASYMSAVVLSVLCDVKNTASHVSLFNRKGNVITNGADEFSCYHKGT
ncbi:MAG: hypothetical protein K2L41_01565 [Muribaculaceae bacterium]|nr:hypothetical protein [Muribaculaceae bacterium]